MNYNSNFLILCKQMRLYQWAKNILIFVPALTSHQILIPNVFVNCLISFFSFSMISSSIYILNDIIDLEYDRDHPNKKDRPIASNKINIKSAYILMVVCLLIGGWLALYLDSQFINILLIYIFINFLYSFYLKKIIILDIIILMTFYTLRLISGHIINNISLSPWLLAFSIFLFFSLGLLKRYIDIMLMSENNINKLVGRGYTIEDGNILMTLGVGSGLISSLVIILYTGSDEVQQIYSSPVFLVILAPLILYWISRIWIMADRKKIKNDPITFALKDINTYIVIFLSLFTMIISKYFIL